MAPSDVIKIAACLKPGDAMVSLTVEMVRMKRIAVIVVQAKNRAARISACRKRDTVMVFETVLMVEMRDPA